MLVQLSAERGSLLQSPRVPEGLSSIKIPGAVPVYGMWGANKCLLQTRPTTVGQLYDVFTSIREPNQLVVQLHQGSLLFHLCLEGKVEYAVEGLPPITLHERAFTFYYVPSFVARVMPGVLSGHSMMICMDPSYLRTFALRFPQIRGILSKIGICPALLSQRPAIADYNILSKAYDLRYQVDGPEAAAHDCIDAALCKLFQGKGVKPIKASADRIEKLYKAKSLITENLQSDYSLMDLETMTGATNYDLRFVFPKIFGLSTQQLRIESSMFWVEKRLVQGVSLQELAMELGYGDESGLRKTFTHFFGKTPTQFRKDCSKKVSNDFMHSYKKSG